MPLENQEQVLNLIKVIGSCKKSISIEKLMGWLSDPNESNEYRAKTFVSAMYMFNDKDNPIIEHILEITRLMSMVTVDKVYLEGFSKWGLDHTQEDLATALRVTSQEQDSLLKIAMNTFKEKMTYEDTITSVLKVMDDIELTLLKKATLLWMTFEAVSGFGQADTNKYLH